MYGGGYRVYNDVEYHEFHLCNVLPGSVVIYSRRLPGQCNESGGGLMITEEEIREIMKSITDSLDSINSTLKEINENMKTADTQCTD